MNRLTIFLVMCIFSFSGHGNSKDTLEYESWENRPKEAFTEPKESFEKVKQMLLKQYYQKGLTEADVYRAAVKGMLENLDPKMSEWNRLLSPVEQIEMRNDVAGEIVGAGVEIKFDSESGQAEVLGIVPGSPASSADVKAGDRILSVNGNFYKGKHLRDVVYDIRGKVGEKRNLSLLRHDKVISRSIALKRLTYANVTHGLLPGGIGLLSINYFTNSTASQIREALLALLAKKVSGLVIDLRGNEGGLFEAATASAELFLSKGKPVVRIARRDTTEEILSSAPVPVIQNLRIVLLVNEQTSSGAEIFSAALKENLGATLVGTHTHGKWSVQKVEELPNKYAAKFTVGLMTSANGNNYAQKGLPPDIEVNLNAEEVEKFKRITDLEKRLAVDNQLRTAVSLLRGRT